MTRNKSDFTSLSSLKEGFTANENFEEITEQHEPLDKDGWYIGTISEIIRKGKSLLVKAEITDFNSEHNYGVINGFLPLSYAKGDITDKFLEAFGHPKMFSDVIGKRCKVYVLFNIYNGKKFANIEGYETL